MALFRLEDVRFNSRTKEVVRGVSMEIDPGTVTALLGKSGSGKSTLLKLIAGILVPSGGKVFYKDTDIQLMNNTLNKRFRRECAFVFQDSALWANQDIQQNLTLPLQPHNPMMSRNAILEKINKICELVNYDRSLNLRPVDLSMGEQKKIAFARALINEPDVLFLDECTESLDKKSGKVILDILSDFVNSGKTIIYVSHSTTFIAAMGGKQFVLDEGLLS